MLKFIVVSLSIFSIAATQSSTTPSNEYSDYEGVGYVSADGNTYIIGGPNNCTVSDDGQGNKTGVSYFQNNVLYINGVEQGALTAEQQQQLQQYKSAVEQWGNIFSNILMQGIWASLSSLFGNMMPSSTTTAPVIETNPQQQQLSQPQQAFPTIPAFCNPQ